MPIASSSAICLSRATGSRPVHPAMTARSIASVSGVNAPLSSTLKVRSYTDDILHSGSQFEDATVRSARGGEHQPDRYFALAMRRQRDRATVEHVDQRAVAQRAQILRGERLVVGEIGDDRRRVGGGRQHQRVIGRNPRLSARNERAAGAEDIDIIGRADALAALDADANAGIVNIALAGEQIAVPGK